MTNINRSAQLTKVHKVLKKHYKPVAPPAERAALEHLLYACCLENARYEAADEAFARLKELYFDWNEIRVTTVSELAEVLAGIPDAAGAGQRIKKALQSVFESAYSFDIEALRKQNLGKAEKDLEKVNGSTPFVRSYVTQHALAGHSIPISKGALDVLYAIGIINDSEADKWQVPGLERAIPKNKGLEFGSLLQQLASDLVASPGSSKVRGILSEIDSGFKDRLAARYARLEAQAAADAAAAKVARDKARAEARAAAAAAEAKPKSSSKSGKGAGKPTARPMDKPAPIADAAKHKPKEKELPRAKPLPPIPTKKGDDHARRPASKGLMKKKPR